ncbi:MAG: hypothetical protein R3327_01265, partial [Nitrosopumilaceae archaeon]|nr:hypothetical protein [Nitrosopumilaceae archaeon]
MTNINAKNIAALSVISVLAMSVGLTNAFADENEYKMVGDIVPVLTFTFRDGVETHTFPVFDMEENLVANQGTTFTVEGVIGKAPLLHKALDKAYDNRLVSANGYEYPMKYFDVDVDFVKNGDSVKTLDYNNCRVQNYKVETLDSNDYESYFKEVGFAIVDKITFECSGVDLDNTPEKATTSTKFTDYGESGFKFANDMRTTVTFLFDAGTEKIEFPIFNLISAYQESTDNVTAEFEVEGLLDNYPLLYNAVEDSIDVSGIGSSSNTDFEAIVEFHNGDETIRGIDFTDCRVTDAKIVTKADKEEGFTGKSGFAVANQFGFQCAGLKGLNPNYSALTEGTPVWKTAKVSNSYDEPLANSASGLQTVATFTYPNGVESIEFSMFTQGSVLSATEETSDSAFTKKATYPTLELRGIVGDYPVLYKYVDDNRKLQSIGGTAQRILVDIDVEIMKDGESIRGFNYSHCRPTNYDVSTDPNNEESYTKNKFAVENIFDFECQGYHPNNPAYDAMYNTSVKANTESTKDLRNTDS